MEKNFIIAGFGGQGVLLAGTILANSFMLAGKNVTWYPCYGAEMRGGTVNCEIVVSDNEVSSVHKKDTDYALVLNQQSFDKFVARIKSGGTVIANSTLVADTRPRNDINYVFAPMGDLANELGTSKVTNMVALGVLSSAIDVVDKEYLALGFEKVMGEKKKDLVPLNKTALEAGYKALN
ncbi:MAG: 2-oxoacid:ferredoxin oxidoreductase subunit gamma [Cyanobacteria bacterium SIG28]|nr:2-oxoacid:ferredoxin oxidoreductase subunit gamma [Cyanobacteria bacterium SIG28]